MIFPDKENGSMNWRNERFSKENVCAYFEVKEVIRYLDDENLGDDVLIYVNDHNRNSYEFTLPATVLAEDSSLCTRLLTHRLTIYDFMPHGVSMYLVDGYGQCLAGNKVSYRHKQLGWFPKDDKYYYLYDQNSIDGIPSISSRKDFKFQHGDKQTYQDFLYQTVFPVQTLSLAMAIGLSAVVSSRLKDHVDVGTIIVNLCGASSTGKTTVEQLMVSPFARPIVSNKDGLIRTFHATTNALFAGMNGIHGLPIVLDDITTNSQIDVSNLLYTIASSEQKGRCKQDGSLREDNYGWSGTVIISSETPIESDGKQNQGLKARVIQTEGVTWTPDAATAEHIKSVVAQNYGFFGREFADYVGSIPIEKLLESYYKAKAHIKQLMVKRDNLSDRLENKYAIVYLTLLLMNKFFKLTLDTHSIIGILIKAEQDSVENRDISKKALECVREFVATNINHFDRVFFIQNQKEQRDHIGTCYGAIEDKYAGECHVRVYSKVLEDLLRRNGINETTTVKQRWKNANVTVTDKGRLDTKLKGVRCSQFRFDKSFFEDDTDKPQISPNVTIKTTVVPPLDDDVDIDEIFGDNQ